MNSVVNPYDSFDPHAYLNMYYSEIGTEGDGLLRFLVDVFVDLNDGITVLEFGGGPTIIGMIAAARRASEIHYADYLPANRDVVQDWLSGNEDAFDWNPFIQRTLQYEDKSPLSDAAVSARAQQIRNAVTRVLACDIFQTPPVHTDQLYDVVTAHYCLDAVTESKEAWYENILKMKRLLKLGGTLVISSLQEARFSNLGGNKFLNVFLQENDVSAYLERAGFLPEHIRVKSAPADHAQR
ncbi:MAG: hypothetical protein GYB68_04795, partial [Chloroflexi bacterium]|nr:hypothetical protein [Chloroflexota bacterium]